MFGGFDYEINEDEEQNEEETKNGCGGRKESYYGGDNKDIESAGHLVQDHPVIARLVEIKSLLDKVKKLDGNLPSEFEDFLKKNCVVEGVENTVMQNSALALPSDSIAKAPSSSIVFVNMVDLAEPLDANQLAKIESLRANQSKEGKSKHKNDQVGIQSKEMLKVRAALEEKLKQKGVFSTLPSKSDEVQKHMKPNGKLETYDDFGDDAIDFKSVNCGLTNGHTSSLGSSKLPPPVTAKWNMQKIISGDDDLPKRDDIGERRRKHELYWLVRE